MEFVESKFAWGDRTVFEAAADAPSRIRSVELLPREGGAKRGILWGKIAFGEAGYGLGPADEAHVGRMPPLFRAGFMVCGCDVKIVYRR